MRDVPYLRFQQGAIVVPHVWFVLCRRARGQCLSSLCEGMVSSLFLHRSGNSAGCLLAKIHQAAIAVECGRSFWSRMPSSVPKLECSVSCSYCTAWRNEEQSEKCLVLPCSARLVIGVDSARSNKYCNDCLPHTVPASLNIFESTVALGPFDRRRPRHKFST